VLWPISSSAGMIAAVVELKESVVAGKFELYKDAANKYRFRLNAGNGEIIAVSEAYESKGGAENGIASVRRNAPDAALDDQT